MKYGQYLLILQFSVGFGLAYNIQFACVCIDFGDPAAEIQGISDPLSSPIPSNRHVLHFGSVDNNTTEEGKPYYLWLYVLGSLKST